STAKSASWCLVSWVKPCCVRCSACSTRRWNCSTRVSSPCKRSMSTTLKMRWRSHRSFCGVRTNGRQSFFHSTSSPPSTPPWLRIGKGTSSLHSQRQRARSRVGTGVKSEIGNGGEDEGLGRAGPDSGRFSSRALSGPLIEAGSYLLFGHHGDGDLGDHLGVQ